LHLFSLMLQQLGRTQLHCLAVTFTSTHPGPAAIVGGQSVINMARGAISIQLQFHCRPGPGAAHPRAAAAPSPARASPPPHLARAQPRSHQIPPLRSRPGRLLRLASHASGRAATRFVGGREKNTPAPSSSRATRASSSPLWRRRGERSRREGSYGILNCIMLKDASETPYK